MPGLRGKVPAMVASFEVLEVLNVHPFEGHSVLIRGLHRRANALLK